MRGALRLGRGLGPEDPVNARLSEAQTALRCSPTVPLALDTRSGLVHFWHAGLCKLRSAAVSGQALRDPRAAPRCPATATPPRVKTNGSGLRSPRAPRRHAAR